MYQMSALLIMVFIDLSDDREYWSNITVQTDQCRFETHERQSNKCFAHLSDKYATCKAVIFLKIS